MKKILIGSLFLAGCATYNHASNVKMVSFSDNLAKGQPVGNIRGEDCTWSILGYETGAPPTLERAVMNAQNQKDNSSLAAQSGVIKTESGAGSLRYLVNMSAKPEGFNAGVVGKKCVVVTGLGYR